MDTYQQPSDLWQYRDAETLLSQYGRAESDRTCCRIVGRWLMRKARQQQREHGTYHAAVNLRKQGVPLTHALMILRSPQ